MCVPGFLSRALQLPVDISKGLSDEAAVGLATKLGFKGDLAQQVNWADPHGARASVLPT